MLFRVLLAALLVNQLTAESLESELGRIFHWGGRARGLEEEYDFIVVGAGPAGSVVASRLSEDPNVTVLLLEAGPEDDSVPFDKVPLAHLLMFYTGFNWKYRAQYDPNACRAMVNGTCPWASGRGVGGGTNINAMMYTRGNKKDFDKWAELGNEGWSYNEVLEHFIKIEKLAINELQDDKFRGTKGNLYIGYPPYRTLGSKVFMEAGKELGYPIIDYNKPYGEGFGHIQTTIKDGKRFNSVSAYLKPAKHRKNLFIMANSLVTKVIIDPETKSAQGVETMYKSKKYTVNARKEVVVSAGAFGSPKLLMLSGIGPKEHLESLGITVLHDSAVGDNLQNQPGSNSLVFTAEHKNFTLIPYKYYDPRVVSILPEYFLHHKGPLSSPGGDSYAYIRTKYAEDEYPDVELIFLGFSYDLDFGNVVRDTLGVRKEVYDKYWPKVQSQNTFSIGVMACYPRSRGTLRLASKDPQDPPIITHNFFNDTTDLKVVVEGLKMAVKIAETQVMKDYGVKVYNKPLPGCEAFEYGTDEYFECAVREITYLLHHQSGTCKMGPDSDPSAVVDPRLRVRGISRLRVVDSSIMPTGPAAHTMAPSYMIGEKGAAMIKEDHKLN